MSLRFSILDGTLVVPVDSQAALEGGGGVEWVVDGWGITPAPAGKGRWLVCYGDPDMAVTSSWHRNRRRAKKEITHYIDRGASRGPFHGVYRFFNKAAGRFWG